jgi:hypothetical protein|tara:strand:- start:2162 stop:2416 length:255 start_codon:yes stop_codon:yes gene_type:complete
MKVVDNTENTKLTHRDLALAAYSLAELHNMYLRAYDEESYGEEMSKEQMEETIERIRVAHTKFDAILQATTPAEEAPDTEPNGE